MPLNFGQVIAQVRLDCRSPELYAPSDDFIMQRIGDVSQLFHVEMQNTSVNWDMDFFDLPVQLGQSEYQVPTGFYGKPSRIHTIDAADHYHITRKIEMVERQNIEEVWQGPEMASSTSLKHTAQGVVLYLKAGVPYLEFVPTPGCAATYRVWFETGELPAPAPSSQPIPNLPAFHRYVRAYAAAQCLPYCEWSEMVDEAMSQAEQEKTWNGRRVELAAGLEPILERWTKAWREYITTDRQVGTGEAIGYAQYYESDVY